MHAVFLGSFMVSPNRLSLAALLFDLQKIWGLEQPHEGCPGNGQLVPLAWCPLGLPSLAEVPKRKIPKKFPSEKNYQAKDPVREVISERVPRERS